MNTVKDRISICIPHWQVKDFMTVCLRGIRKHSKAYDIEVIVVDNGSKDESLDWLRSLSWIKLIERPEEVHTNWPTNVFTGWNVGLQHASGEFYLTMHTDVFVLSDDWLDPLVREIGRHTDVAGAGVWKLRHQNPIYAMQKKLFYYPIKKLKYLLGLRRDSEWKTGHYPRDFCALYRSALLRKHHLSFLPDKSRGFPYDRAGGFSIAKQLWDCGYETRMVSVSEMITRIVHVAHGTAGVSSEKSLSHKKNQERVESRVGDISNQEWFQTLLHNDSLDQPEIY